MLTMIGFLRRYAGIVLLIFVLLFAMAMTDLALPDYMSRIVNVGIQQNGQAEPVPQVIRQETMARASLLLDEAARSEVAANWQLLDSASLPENELAEKIHKYPLLASEVLLELKEGHVLSEAAKDQLETAFAVLSFISQPDFQLPGLPEGTDLADFWAGLDPAEQAALQETLSGQLKAVPQSLLSQSAVAYLLGEYTVIGFDLAALQTRYIIRTGSYMLLIALFGAACAVLVGFLAARVAAGVARDLRLEVFSRVESFSSAEFDTFSTASLITRTTNDIQQVQVALVMLMRILFFAPILGTGGILRVIGSNNAMTWIIAMAVAILIVLIIIMFTLALPRFKLVQKLVDRLNLVTREILAGLMVIRAFNTQNYEEKRFDTANQDLTRLNLFVNRLIALAMPLMMLVMNLISLLIIWVGARQVDLGNMQVGDIMAFIQYTMQILMSFLMLAAIFVMLPRASVSAQRIKEILGTEPVIIDPDQPLPFQAAEKGRVVFENVTFRYPNAHADVLHNISFTALPGQTTAIIGSTGCGKSTLVNLIPRFHDTSSGQVLVEGIDVRQANLEDLRQKIGYVSQKGILFTGSIAENIAYGKPDAASGEIESAAATAQATGFILGQEEGFSAWIAQGGSNVSGGQKQRLAIARALVRKPQIYIFDDSFSALDYRTDAALRQALQQTTKDATIFIVAQRVGTIRHADQIIVLDEGRIVGLGRHEDLLQTRPVYLEIAASQLTEEELAI